MSSSSASSPESSTRSTHPDVGRVKDGSREGRLSFRNFAEHQLRNEFKQQAIEKCDLQVRAFAECGKEEGLMVIVRCRDFQKAVNECLGVYGAKDRFEQYKKEHESDMENKIIRSKN
jgi:hypothetical protein